MLLSTYDITSSYDVTETTSNMTTTKDFTAQRTVAMVLSVVLLIGGTYLLITLSFYEYQVALKNRKVVKKKLLCLLAAVFTLLRFIFEIVEVFESSVDPSPCTWVRQVKAILQCGAITCIYLVLWFRQRQFYRMPTLEHHNTRTIRFFSGSVIVIMVIANLVTILLYLVTRAYHASGRGCVVLWSTVWTKLPGLFLFIFTTAFQVILVGLLINLLCKHGTSSSLSGSNRQIQLIKRVSIAAVVAVLTTALASLLAITAFSGNYGALRQVVYDVDLLVSLLTIILSFEDWKARVTSCLAKVKPW